MFRLVLTAVVLLLLSLPQGICFCDMVETALVSTADHDDDEEHESDDCSCKLIQIMAVADASAPQKNTPIAGLLTIHACSFSMDECLSCHVCPLHRAASEPIPLIPCALRI